MGTDQTESVPHTRVVANSFYNAVTLALEPVLMSGTIEDARISVYRPGLHMKPIVEYVLDVPEGKDVIATYHVARSAIQTSLELETRARSEENMHGKVAPLSVLATRLHQRSTDSYEQGSSSTHPAQAHTRLRRAVSGSRPQDAYRTLVDKLATIIANPSSPARDVLIGRPRINRPDDGIPTIEYLLIIEIGRTAGLIDELIDKKASKAQRAMFEQEGREQMYEELADVRGEIAVVFEGLTREGELRLTYSFGDPREESLARNTSYRNVLWEVEAEARAARQERLEPESMTPVADLRAMVAETEAPTRPIDAHPGLSPLESLKRLADLQPRSNDRV